MEDSKANLFPDPQIHIFVSKIDLSDNNPVIFFPNILFHNGPSCTFQNKAILFTHSYCYQSLAAVKSSDYQTKEHLKILTLEKTPLRKPP